MAIAVTRSDLARRWAEFLYVAIALPVGFAWAIALGVLIASVLSDRGLDAALSGLAERASVPVEIRGGAGGRLPAALETAAYYVVAETLTNAAKHAEASRAHVAISRADGVLVLEIGDDGKGGARRVPGSGLEGLAQRVEALDGTLEVRSPDGGPTTITAKLPCAS